MNAKISDEPFLNADNSYPDQMYINYYLDTTDVYGYRIFSMYYSMYYDQPKTFEMPGLLLAHLTGENVRENLAKKYVLLP